MTDILNFPDDLLIRILSFLPTKEAVRTSVNSKEWQKMVNSLTFLYFDDGSNSKRVEEGDAYNFMNFVDGVLINHKGDVDKFRMVCGRYVDPNRIRRWIRYAISNRVRELDLNFKHDLDSLPLTMFTCETLEVLRLWTNVNITSKLHAKIYLPNLKALYLSGRVSLEWDDNDWIQTLISGCTMLEELEINTCKLNQNCSISVPTLKRLNIGFIGGTIHIDAPNLVYFKYYYFGKNLSVKNLNFYSLVEADIHFEHGRIDEDYDTATIDLFKAISNVKSLHMSGFFGEYVFRRVVSFLPMLSNVTHLSFETRFDKEWQSWISWKRWILFIPQAYPNAEAFDLNVMNDIEAIHIMFEDIQSEVLMIEYLLKCAVSLEKFTVYGSSKWSSVTREELLKFKEVLNECRLTFP